MPKDFTIMTWNLENLFEVGEPSGPTEPQVYEQKQKNIASIIHLINPDVLAVQEIGSPAAFDFLLQQLQAEYPYFKLSTYIDQRNIRVGFLAKLPLTQIEEFYDFPKETLPGIPDGAGGQITHFGRGALKVKVEPIAKLPINLITCHLKSKLISYPPPPDPRFYPHNETERTFFTEVALLRRAAEAAALRIETNRLVTGNNQPLILLGDLNDQPEALTTQMLLGPEDGSLKVRDKGDDVRLYNLTSYLPEVRRYSRVYKKSKELIDQILVSHELILAKYQVDSYVEIIESIGQNPASRRNAVLPDHAPVFARFNL